MQLIFSNKGFNRSVIELSEYCLMFIPLHFFGPSSENVPITKTPDEFIFCSAIFK
jgi:hypothetical protein